MNHCKRMLAACVIWLTFGQGVVVNAQVSTTINDFFMPGSQPETLNVPLAESQSCSFCHGGYAVEAIHDRWKASAMAQATRDPLFHACLTVANQDADFAGDICLRCHTPQGWISGRSVPTDGSNLINTDYDGVSCSVCHRMVDPVYQPGVSPAADFSILDAIANEPGNQIPPTAHTGSFILDPDDVRRGPYDLDADLQAEGLGDFFLHEYEVSPYHRDSSLCATCHDVSNPAYERVGGATPSNADTYVLTTIDAPHPTQNKFDMFPIERTYSEWLNSDFADGPVELSGRFGGNITAVSTCQDCHMPKTTNFGCGIDGQRVERDDMPIHDFLGAANWMLDAVVDLDQSLELYPIDAISGLTQQEVDDAKGRNDAFMKAASDLEVTFDTEIMNVRVINETGHKLPTGYPEGRRMWITVRFFDGADDLVAEFGGYDPGTAILDTATTKVYEAKLGLDTVGAAATGLPEGESFHFVLNNTYVKDNRIPPRGFTNAAFEAVQASPVNYTYADGQNWDDTEFIIPCDAVTAEVGVYYQTSSKEYVEFLRDENTTDMTGDILYDLWVANGKSAPIEMDFQTITLGDCDGNDRFDGCDIEDGLLTDGNGNLLPDECETPVASGLGSRYLSIEPQSLGQAIDVAMVMTSSELPCYEQYLDADGNLTGTPVYQTPAEWGELVVKGEEIVPGITYDVQIEFLGGLRSAITSVDTYSFGDVNGNDVANFEDIQFIVLGFQGNFDNAAREALDLFPCIPNNVINFEDIQQGVLAFQGLDYADTICTIPCQ
ncbi:MAG: hypothetical protein ACPGXK_03370 [Phycisphaerae bacterium]